MREMPTELVKNIKSYLIKCNYCGRIRISSRSIYCDNKCYYIHKKNEFIFFRNFLLIYAFLFVYGNVFVKMYGVMMIMIVVDNLF